MRQYSSAGLAKLRAAAAARRTPPLTPDQIEIVRRMRVEDNAPSVVIAKALGCPLGPVYGALRALKLPKLGGRRTAPDLKIRPRQWLAGEAEKAAHLRYDEGLCVSEIATLLGRMPLDVSRKLSEIAAAKAAVTEETVIGA